MIWGSNNYNRWSHSSLRLALPPTEREKMFPGGFLYMNTRPSIRRLNQLFHEISGVSFRTLSSPRRWDLDRWVRPSSVFWHPSFLVQGPNICKYQGFKFNVNAGGMRPNWKRIQWGLIYETPTLIATSVKLSCQRFTNLFQLTLAIVEEVSLGEAHTI